MTARFAQLFKLMNILDWRPVNIRVLISSIMITRKSIFFFHMICCVAILIDQCGRIAFQLHWALLEFLYTFSLWKNLNIEYNENFFNVFFVIFIPVYSINYAQWQNIYNVIGNNYSGNNFIYLFIKWSLKKYIII